MNVNTGRKEGSEFDVLQPVKKNPFFQNSLEPNPIRNLTTDFTLNRILDNIERLKREIQF